MANGSLEDLFEVQDKESIEDLFKDAFKNLNECRRSLDNMRAGKASTPASDTDIKGLVPQGEGGTVVRIPRRQVHQVCPRFLYHWCLLDPPALKLSLSFFSKNTDADASSSGQSSSSQNQEHNNAPEPMEEGQVATPECAENPTEYDSEEPELSNTFQNKLKLRQNFLKSVTTKCFWKSAWTRTSSLED